MPLRLSLFSLYAAPGFFDPNGDAPPSMSEERAAAMYAFLPAGTTFQRTDDDLLIGCPDPGKKRLADAAELFERASRRAREGDHDKAIKLYESGLALDVLHTTARRDLAMSRMANTGATKAFGGIWRTSQLLGLTASGEFGLSPARSQKRQI